MFVGWARLNSTNNADADIAAFVSQSLENGPFAEQPSYNDLASVPIRAFGPLAACAGEQNIVNCTACTDVPSELMIARGRTCSDATLQNWFILQECKTEAWQANLTCQKSCEAGLFGYGTDPPCCPEHSKTRMDDPICGLTQLTIIPRHVYFGSLENSTSFMFSVILFGMTLLTYTISVMFTKSQDELAEAGRSSSLRAPVDLYRRTTSRAEGVQQSTLLSEVQSFIGPIKARWSPEALQANITHKAAACLH